MKKAKRRNNIIHLTDLSFKVIRPYKEKDNSNDDTRSFFSKPDDDEVKFFKDRAASYGPDEVIPIVHWDGKCWKGFLEKGLCEILADNDMEKAWDYLAIFIHQQFEEVYRQGFYDGCDDY